MITWLFNGKPCTKPEVTTLYPGDLFGHLTLINTRTRPLVNLYVFDPWKRCEFARRTNRPYVEELPLGTLGVGRRVSVWARARTGGTEGPSMVQVEER